MFLKNWKGRLALAITIFTLLSLFLISGCIKQANPPEYVKVRGYYTTPEGTFNNPSPCMALVCKNQTGVMAFFKKLFGNKPSLYKGNCSLRSFDPLEEAEMKDLRNIVALNASERIRSFMIGQGPNLAAASEAQRFCDGNLGFALHYLSKDNVTDTALIKRDLKGVLSNDVIPAFIFNHTESNPGGVYTSDITGALVGEGPSIVVIGMNLTGTGLQDQAGSGGIVGAYNPIPSTSFGGALDDIYTVNCTCPNCLVAVHIISNDTSFLSAATQIHSREEHYVVDNQYGSATPQTSSCGQGGGTTSFRPINAIDIVFYEVDLNKYDCNNSLVLGHVQNFSSYILETYGKPSVLILKSKVSSKCTGEKIAQAYEYLYSNIPLMVPGGLLGMATDDFSSLFNSSDRQDSPMFNAWFQNCRFYHSDIGLLESPKVPLLFPENGDMVTSGCTFLNSASMLLNFKCNQNYSELKGIEPFDFNVSYGDARCAEEGALSPAGSGAQISEDVGKVLDGYEQYCERWSPQIRQFSAEFDYDPSIARALRMLDPNFGVARDAAVESQVCASCQRYTEENKKLCCAVAKLAYYKNYTTANLAAADNWGIRNYTIYYFSIYGYLSGLPALQSQISNYNSNNGEGYPYSDMAANQVLSSALRLRKACGICSQRPDLGSVPSGWSQTATFPSMAKPMLKPNCTQAFGSNMGVYWLSGITITNSSSTSNSVYTALPGRIVKIGDGARRFKYIITEGSGFTATYSNLVTVSKYITEGQTIESNKYLGTAGDFLRFETCQGTAQQCMDTSLGPNRPFRNPASALGLTCPQ